MNNEVNMGQLFEEKLSREIKEKFYHVDVVRVSPLHCHDVNDIDGFLIATKKLAKI